MQILQTRVYTHAPSYLHETETVCERVPDGRGCKCCGRRFVGRQRAPPRPPHPPPCVPLPPLLACTPSLSPPPTCINHIHRVLTCDCEKLSTCVHALCLGMHVCVSVIRACVHAFTTVQKHTHLQIHVVFETEKPTGQAAFTNLVQEILHISSMYKQSLQTRLSKYFLPLKEK